MRNRRRRGFSLGAVLAVLLAATPARAEYPERPVRILEPFPPGGAVDIVTRLVAARLADDLGRPVLVESKPGAGGIIATDAVAKAPHDGYTLLVTTPNHTINAALNPKLPYDTEKDLVPVAVIAEVPELLVANAAAPFATLRGVRRLRAPASGQARLRVGRHRHPAACLDGAAAAAGSTSR